MPSIVITTHKKFKLPLTSELPRHLNDGQPQDVIEKLKDKVIQLGDDLRLQRKVTEIKVNNAGKLEVRTNADETFEGHHAVIGATLHAVNKINGVQELVTN